MYVCHATIISYQFVYFCTSLLTALQDTHIKALMYDTITQDEHEHNIMLTTMRMRMMEKALEKRYPHCTLPPYFLPLSHHSIQYPLKNIYTYFSLKGSLFFFVLSSFVSFGSIGNISMAILRIRPILQKIK